LGNGPAIGCITYLQQYTGSLDMETGNVSYYWPVLSNFLLTSLLQLGIAKYNSQFIETAKA